MNPEDVLETAREVGFELCGLTPALPHAHYARYQVWCATGMAAGMRYLTDHRAGVRADPRNLLPEAQTMLCVGKLYQTAGPGSYAEIEAGRGWISRYAWGERDYHDVVREGLEEVVARLRRKVPFAFTARVCVDTAPLLERSYAREAGLGWIGRNACLINEPRGSWFFLGEALFSFAVEEWGRPPADRCGTCTRCIEACPTSALVPGEDGWQLDSKRCISYWTIEAKESAPAELRTAFGNHLFGCDICQDVCPWNRRAPYTSEPGFQPKNAAPELAAMAGLTEEEFRRRFRQSPVWRAKQAGMARNVEIAIENERRGAALEDGSE